MKLFTKYRVLSGQAQPVLAFALFARVYLPLLLLLLSFSSCIGEDMDDCPTGMKIYFDYEPATYARIGVDPAEVKRIDLFVFDGDGIFRGVWTDHDPVLTTNYYITITGLPQNDTYRFIAWAGPISGYLTTPSTFIAGTTTFEQARLYLEHASGTIDSGIAPLFHAEKTQYIDNSAEQRVDMLLAQVYNTLNLTTEGLENNTKTYRMTVYDNNGNYRFDCSFATDSDFKYTTLCDKDTDGQLFARLDILKLAANRNPVFEVSDTDGNVLFRENLVTLINALGSNTYDRIHTYDIHLKFGLSVSVSINGWWVVEDGIIL